jgi:hypothetical protein
MAQLQWPHRSIELRPKPDEPQVVATFPFTNAGKEPVTITSLKTSCDCTTASLAKHTYAPGEGGEITATFTVGGRSGLQSKTILVQTTDKAEGTILARNDSRSLFHVVKGSCGVSVERFWHTVTCSRN